MDGRAARMLSFILHTLNVCTGGPTLSFTPHTLNVCTGGPAAKAVRVSFAPEDMAMPADSALVEVAPLTLTLASGGLIEDFCTCEAWAIGVRSHLNLFL